MDERYQPKKMPVPAFVSYPSAMIKNIEHQRLGDESQLTPFKTNRLK